MFGNMSNRVNPYAFDDTLREADNRRLTKYSTVGVYTDDEAIEIYMPHVRYILESAPNYGKPPEPSEIYPGVYIGSVANAENKTLLKRLGITHILNCDGHPVLRPERMRRYEPAKETGIIEYEEILAQDGETYDITYHFLKAFRFIDSGRMIGRVLLYCTDVNRVGAIGLGYLIHRGVSLCDAAQTLKNKRQAALYNKGFMRQLILYAKDHSMLENPQRTHFMSPHFSKYGKIKDRTRDSHLLQFL